MKKLLTALNKNRILFLAALIFSGMFITDGNFRSTANLSGLFESMAAFGIVALGLTYVMIAGQLDISMGSVLALTACVFMMLAPTLGFFPAMIASLALGCVLGAITGFMVAFFRLSPFIVSMTTQIMYKGIALALTSSRPVAFSEPTLVAISKAHIGVIPATFIFFVAAAILMQLILRRTQYGRNLFVIGGNIGVADNLGLKVRGHLWSVFIVQGLLAALGGLAMMTRTFSASGNLAIDSPLSVIPMVIIGGTAFSGGKGGTIETLLGVLLMNIIYNSMSMFSIPVSMQQFIKGAILLAIIVSDKYLENRDKKV